MIEGRVFALIALIFVSIGVIYRISKARGGHVYKLRHIAGMDALEEAVGRATEMGRPIHFTPGIGDIAGQTAAQTFAGLETLGMVSRLTAKYGARIIVTIRTPLVLPIAEEVVRQSYMAEGAVDAYDMESVQYLSSEQFAYAAGVMGIMKREQVAANIMLGAFWAESMMLAETGRQVGAIQIAGTAHLHQIAFFVAACDYTLLGEELFAAGAIASENTVKLGSIAGQDIGKAFALLLIVLGVISQTAGSSWLNDLVAK